MNEPIMLDLWTEGQPPPALRVGQPVSIHAPARGATALA